MNTRIVRSVWFLGFVLFLATACSQKSVRPTSYQAEVIESLDGDRVRVSAVGIAKNSQAAILDGYRAAVYRVSQDLVQSQEERIAFEGVMDEVFERANQYVERYTITGRRVEPRADVKLDLDLVVNRSRLNDDLVALGVLRSQRDLMTELRNPSMVVLPEAKIAEQSWQRFATDRVTSYLTSRRFEVLDAGQIQQVDAMTRQSRAAAGLSEDPQAAIALQIGGDVYVVFDVNLSRGTAGGTGTVKASASVRAFETTTSRAVGSATGFSREYAATAGSDERAIAEALNDAIDRVLVNVMDYWKDDAIKGFQFLVEIRGDFSGAEGRRIRRTIHQTMGSTTSDMQENLATEQTLNYRVWYKGNNTDLLFALQDKIEAETQRELRSISQNRKLLQLQVE